MRKKFKDVIIAYNPPNGKVSLFLLDCLVIQPSTEIFYLNFLNKVEYNILETWRSNLT